MTQRKIPQSKKIPGKAFLNYELARSFPIWGKYKIGAPVIKQVPPNSAWIIHWWRQNEELNVTEQVHLEVLRKAKGLFKRVIVFYASELPIPEGLDGVTFVRIQNDKTRGEEISFIEAIGQALKGDCDYVLRTHFKGKKEHYDMFRMKNILFWNALMYDYLFDVKGFDSIMYGAVDCTERHWLDPYLAAIPGRVGDLVSTAYQNHYCGSFYWINCKHFREWCAENQVTWEDFIKINGNDVPGKPWHCEVLLTSMIEQINAPMQIDFSPYYMYDWWILNDRPMKDGKPYVGKLQECVCERL